MKKKRFFKPKCREGYKKFGDVVENSKLNFASTVCLLAKEIFDPLSPSDLLILSDVTHFFSPFSFPGSFSSNSLLLYYIYYDL